MDQKDLRHYSRVMPAFPVVITAPGMAGRTGVIHDVSAQGIFVRIDPAGLAGLECEVSISLSDEARITVRGLVSRTEATGIGIRFAEFEGAAAHRHLINLVRYNASDIETVEREIGILRS